MQITVKRVVTAVMIVGGAITGYQILSRPQPVAAPQSVAETRANAQSFDQKIEVIETARDESTPPAEVHFTSAEVSAEVAQSMGAIPAATPGHESPPSSRIPSSVRATCRSKAIRCNCKETLHAASLSPTWPAKMSM